jgi:hypothetical protein
VKNEFPKSYIIQQRRFFFTTFIYLRLSLNSS